VDSTHCYVVVRLKDDEFQIQRDDGEWIRLKSLYRITLEDEEMWLHRKDDLITKKGLKMEVKKNDRIYLPCVFTEDRFNANEHSFHKFILTKFARKYNIDLSKEIRVRYTRDGLIQIRNRRNHWVTRASLDHIDRLTHLRRLNSEEGFNEELKRQGDHVYVILPRGSIVSRKTPVQLNFTSFARRHNVDLSKRTVRLRIQSGYIVDVQNKDGDWLLFYDFEHSNLQQIFDTYGECLVSTPIRKSSKPFAPPQLMAKRRVVPLTVPHPVVRISIDPHLWEETNSLATDIVNQLYPQHHYHGFTPMHAGKHPHMAQHNAPRSAVTPHPPQDYQHTQQYQQQHHADDHFHAGGEDVGQSFINDFEHHEWQWDDDAHQQQQHAVGMKRRNPDGGHQDAQHATKRPRMEDDYHFQFNMDDELAL